MGQTPEVFSRFEDSEVYWEQLVKCNKGYDLDTCLGVKEWTSRFEEAFPISGYYESLAVDYAHFFSRKQCESLSLYKEIVDYIESEFKEDYYIDFIRTNAYLAGFLSGLNPVYEGDYGRKGIWGLTYPVARKYGLRVDEWVDERFSVIHATRAAWWYYFDLMRMYDNHELVRLGFITSPALLEKYIQSSIDGDPLLELLPLEAAQTVFELDLMEHVFSTNWYYFSQNHIRDFEKNTVAIYPKGCIQFAVLEEILALQKGSIKTINPVFVSEQYPESYRNTPLRLPKNYLSDYKKLEDSIVKLSIADEKGLQSTLPQEKMKDENTTRIFEKYEVKSGDALSLIAEKYGVLVSDIMRWNNLSNDKIFIGQRLLLYPKEKVQDSSKIVNQYINNQDNEAPKGTAKIYVVKEGDNLWMISQLYPGISAEQIAKWNTIKNNQIYPGQRLKIYARDD